MLEYFYNYYLAITFFPFLLSNSCIHLLNFISFHPPLVSLIPFLLPLAPFCSVTPHIDFMSSFCLWPTEFIVTHLHIVGKQFYEQQQDVCSLTNFNFLKDVNMHNSVEIFSHALTMMQSNIVSF